MLIRRNFTTRPERDKILAAKFDDLGAARKADIRYFRDNRLSYRARGIMSYLFSHVDHWNPMQKDLVSKSEKDGKHTIAQAVKELVGYGYLVKVKEVSQETGLYTHRMIAFEVALDNPAYNPSSHGVAYYAKELKTAEEKESLEVALLSYIDMSEVKPMTEFEQFFGRQEDELETPNEATGPAPSDPLDHVMQIKQAGYEALNGKTYTQYAYLAQDHFIAVRTKDGGPTNSDIMAIGSFLMAYHKVTGQELPIPGALQDKKYWLKTFKRHLENYKLIQLESMYPMALQAHFENELSFKSPDSITGGLLEAYQTLKAQVLAHHEKLAKVDAARNAGPAKVEIDPAESILNWAKAKDGSRHNSHAMWRGVIFKSETDKKLVLDKYKGMAAKIDNETESAMREKLAKGELILRRPLSYDELSDLFHFRTEDEDKSLFAAFIFTQRGLNADFDPVAFRKEKSKPLAYDLEDCELPKFYKSLVSIESGADRLQNLRV